MTALHDLDAFLASASVDPAVHDLRPDYRALLLVVDGITRAPQDDRAEKLLTAAEESARDALAETELVDIPHIAAWREAYRAFGAKPQRTRNSLEALMRRAGDGMPRVNPLTDIYNAISVTHQVPLGGEDIDHYVGSPHLVRATGDEDFATMAAGEEAIEHPDQGEVVWRDDEGVTCRRWNWRQCRRTALSDDTSAMVFFFDALEPMSDDALQAAADELLANLTDLGDDVRWAQRLIRA